MPCYIKCNYKASLSCLLHLQFPPSPITSQVKVYSLTITQINSIHTLPWKPAKATTKTTSAKTMKQNKAKDNLALHQIASYTSNCHHWTMSNNSHSNLHKEFTNDTYSGRYIYIYNVVTTKIPVCQNDGRLYAAQWIKCIGITWELKWYRTYTLPLSLFLSVCHF